MGVRSSGAADERVAARGAAPASEEISDFSEEGADAPTGPASSDLRADFSEICDDGSGELEIKSSEDDTEEGPGVRSGVVDSVPAYAIR